MSSYTDRQEIQALRAELQEFKREFNQKAEAIVSRMDRALDALAVAASDEVDAGTERSTKIMTYGERGKGESKLAEPIKPEQVSSVPQVELPKGKRACSLCRQSGHRAKNCPNAHLIHAEKQAKVAKRDAKREKPKRTVSPERRAQLAEQLTRARVARRKK